MLCFVGFSLGWWRPTAGLFAFVLSVPLINGLQLTVLPVPDSAILIIASSLWLGLSVSKLIPAPLGETARIAPTTSIIQPVGRMRLTIDVLATMALVSMYFQIWRHGDTPELLKRLWPPPSAAGRDTSYFLTGFLWLNGLFFLRTIQERSQLGITAPSGIKLVFIAHGSVLLFFFGVQWKLEIPFHWTPGFQSPFEDIATFGIMAACLMLVCIAMIRRGRWHRSCALGLTAILLGIAVAASWSRGTWLATVVFLGTLLLLRVPRFATILMLIALFAAIGFLNWQAKRISLENRPFLARLISLVQPESLGSKSSGRLELYKKALTMIQERPWTGLGIGSFYRDEIVYSKPDDPYAQKHQLSHNIVLQLAAEQGVPVAALFVGLVGWTFWRGIGCWNSCRSLQATRVLVPEHERTEAHLVLALTIVLGVYLQANMTWDILTVHPTQPFFFSFLLAALWATTDHVNVSNLAISKSTPAVT